MNLGPIRLWALWLVAVLGLAAAQPALAATPTQPSCHASAVSEEGYAQLARQPARWNCTGSGWSVDSPRTILRFDVRGADHTPTLLTTRLTRFAAMRLTVIGAGGRTASRTVTTADMTPATSDWLMATHLPRIAGPVAAVIVRVEGARHAG